ncbi:3-isopropylmalate dehydrogenase [Vineibacter terrae]|uniref:3-isopropylmalate dehydrogenase n=1 Tax=Vineibacter terrae TaxID=2586908 RepID=UPI002E311318|nr:3-isopropylmalate dehydrogenase [Vineibacter terrae]HEX2887256.1 3-isopropylmalate dehydrogenase [Vineibacter terrae]
MPSSSNSYRLLILPGDGIGPEVMAEVRRVAEWFRDRRALPIDLRQRHFGLASWQAHGSLMPDETWAEIEAADAILFGAMDSLDQAIRIPPSERRKGSLLRLRKNLDTFANLRPIRAVPGLLDASTLKREVVDGVDLVFVRELTGGVYFGEPRGVETLPDGRERGVNTHVYTSDEVERVARFAFELARRRRADGKPGRVHSVDKSNVMEAGAMWRRIVQRVHDADYADVELHHMLADNCAMQLIRWPRQFDVIVTDNLFGDLLSDCGAMITGSLGMLPSASLSARGGASNRRRALYEPIHGSAPDIAGRGIANPLAAILSFGMCLRETMEMADEADRLERAVDAVLADGARTADLAAPGQPRLSTAAMGDAVLEALGRA